MRFTGALIAFLAVVCSGSCSGTAASSRCVTGASIQCACNGGLAGAQVCGGDGAYSTCVCDPIDDVEPAAARDMSCTAVVAHMGRVSIPDAGDGEDGLDVDEFLRQMCATWSEQMRRCVLDATGPADLEPCAQYLPEEMRGDDDYVDERDEVDDDIDEDEVAVDPVDMIGRIYQDARAYYMDSRRGAGNTRMKHQFPEPSAGPTPPLGTCCGVATGCSPHADLWENEPWPSLMFSVDEPTYYSYEYEVDNATQQYYARAYGDLDCDGTYSTFELHGYIEAEFSDAPSGSPKLRTILPYE